MIFKSVDDRRLSAGRLESVGTCAQRYQENYQERGRIIVQLIEQRDFRDDQMGKDDVRDQFFVVRVQPVEEQYLPEYVQEYGEGRENRRHHAERAVAAAQSHRSGPADLGQNVDQREQAAHDAESQTGNVGQHVFVAGHERVGDEPFQAALGFAQQQIEKVPEQFLDQHGHEHAEPHLLFAGEREPHHGREQQAEQPEERAGYQYDDAHGIVHDGHDEHGQRRAERGQRATGELQQSHRGGGSPTEYRREGYDFERTDRSAKNVVNTERFAHTLLLLLFVRRIGFRERVC